MENKRAFGQIPRRSTVNDAHVLFGQRTLTENASGWTMETLREFLETNFEYRDEGIENAAIAERTLELDRFIKTIGVGLGWVSVQWNNTFNGANANTNLTDERLIVAKGIPASQLGMYRQGTRVRFDQDESGTVRPRYAVVNYVDTTAREAYLVTYRRGSGDDLLNIQPTNVQICNAQFPPDTGDVFSNHIYFRLVVRVDSIYDIDNFDTLTSYNAVLGTGSDPLSLTLGKGSWIIRFRAVIGGEYRTDSSRNIPNPRVGLSADQTSLAPTGEVSSNDFLAERWTPSVVGTSFAANQFQSTSEALALNLDGDADPETPYYLVFQVENAGTTSNALARNVRIFTDTNMVAYPACMA